MADIPIFWVEPTGKHHFRGTWRCPNKHYTRREIATFEPPRKPIPCDECGELAEGFAAGKFEEFVRPDTGETFATWQDLPVGACYDANVGRDAHNWVSKKHGIKHRPNKQDGRVLVVILPDGHPWTIDSRANNCTMPDDDKHWCWVREGRPEDGSLNVTKNGRTCAAGAGSIMTGKYHGFLRHGKLTNC